MSFTVGSRVRLTIFGESHGAGVGAVLEGLPAGLPIDMGNILRRLRLRQPQEGISTERIEDDTPRIISGSTGGFSNGGPLTIFLENRSQKGDDYPSLALRPSHADYTGLVKYGGYGDFRGGGFFSGRMTAPLAAAGAVAAQALEHFGVLIGSHISSCAEVRDDELDESGETLREQLTALNDSFFPVLNPEAGERMRKIIMHAREEGDSVGGTVETAVDGLPEGVGSPFFDSIESVLSRLLFSIPGVKGVEFGLGFGFSYLRGSEVNDQLTVRSGKIRTRSNFSGGINGGISNGMPILFRVVFRPTPSIATEQITVDPSTLEEKPMLIKGRHDPAIFHRGRAAVEAVTALGLLDLLAERGWDIWPPKV